MIWNQIPMNLLRHQRNIKLVEPTVEDPSNRFYTNQDSPSIDLDRPNDQLNDSR